MLPHSVNCDDRLDAAVGVFDPSFTALPGWFSGDMEPVRASINAWRDGSARATTTCGNI
jgi:hypothetical protein